MEWKEASYIGASFLFQSLDPDVDGPVRDST
jgi:hypothetical protein